MNQTLKAGILLATLAIPVFIWLFLKNFGQNQFELPVYYEDNLPTITGCDDQETPHKVAFFAGQTSESTGSGTLSSNKVSVTYLLPEVCENECQLVMEQLANLQTTFSDIPDFQIVVVASQKYYDSDQISSYKNRYLANPQIWKFVLLNADRYDQLYRCEFFLTKNELSQALVLTDDAGSIRGYYAGFDSDDIDRLKGELKILFYMQETTNNVKDSK
jgi:protein SCO1/2